MRAGPHALFRTIEALHHAQICLLHGERQRNHDRQHHQSPSLYSSAAPNRDGSLWSVTVCSAGGDVQQRGDDFPGSAKYVTRLIRQYRRDDGSVVCRTSSTAWHVLLGMTHRIRSVVHFVRNWPGS